MPPTADGYYKLTKFQDFVDTVERFPPIDTIKYSRKNPMERTPVYVVLYSVAETKGYGGAHVTEKTFEKLQAHFAGKLAFVETL